MRTLRVRALLGFLLLMGSTGTAFAQNTSERLSLGVEYAYLAQPGASGIGLTATRQISDRFAVGLRSDIFVPTHRERTSAFTRSEYEETLWTVSAHLNVEVFRRGAVALYGVAGLQHRRSTTEGKRDLFNDVPPYGTTTRQFESTQNSLHVQAGGGIEIRSVVTFFAEPTVILHASPHLSLSGGLRVSL